MSTKEKGDKLEDEEFDIYYFDYPFTSIYSGGFRKNNKLTHKRNN